MIPSTTALAFTLHEGTVPTKQESEWSTEGLHQVPKAWGAPVALTEPHAHVQTLHRRITPAVVVTVDPNATELRSMRAQIELLSREIKELRDKLLMKGSEQFALASSNGNGTEVAIDPHLQWIEEHSVELRKYPRTWLAIHPRRGIVFHAQTADELEDQLDNLTPEERRELLTFNTTPYA